jgi:hypothetical protein
VEITDGARIAAILGRIEEIREQDIYEGRIGEPWPADFRLDFVGQNRRLYEVRLGQGALQQTIVRFSRWAKWPITDEQQSSLLDLIQSTDGE